MASKGDLASVPDLDQDGCLSIAGKPCQATYDGHRPDLREGFCNTETSSPEVCARHFVNLPGRKWFVPLAPAGMCMLCLLRSSKDAGTCSSVDSCMCSGELMMLKYFLVYSLKQVVGHLEYHDCSVSFAGVCKDIPSMLSALCLVNTHFIGSLLGYHMYRANAWTMLGIAYMKMSEKDRLHGLERSEQYIVTAQVLNIRVKQWQHDLGASIACTISMLQPCARERVSCYISKNQYEIFVKLGVVYNSRIWIGGHVSFMHVWSGPSCFMFLSACSDRGVVRLNAALWCSFAILMHRLGVTLGVLGIR